jgi:hypothetical protein
MNRKLSGLYPACAVITITLLLSTISWASAKETILYDFPTDTGNPQNLIADGHGNFYGVASGTRNNAGAVFELTRSSDGRWTENTIYTFSGGADGGYPEGSLVLDEDGNIYGTTYSGGGPNYDRYCWGQYINGCGTVFELSKLDGVWSEKVLYAFQGITDGMAPIAGLTLHNGKIYGTTSNGGNGNPDEASLDFGAGTVFELSLAENGHWTETIIYRFPGSCGPAYPESNVVFDGNDNLYGTTLWGGGAGGSCGCGGCGVVYELTPSADNWTFAAIHNFSMEDGSGPLGNLLLDTGGNLYGVTEAGGPDYLGVAFQLSPGSDGWTENVLHAFQYGTDGATPLAGLTMDARGDLYGSTFNGGGLGNCYGYNQNDCGTVFELTPGLAGGAEWTETILHAFSGIERLPGDGQGPDSNVILDDKRNVFGVTPGGGIGAGIFFELSP